MRLGLGLGLVRLGKAIASFVRDGLKLYYPFKDNSPELLLSGATSFDGSDDYINLGQASNLNFDADADDFTISLWFKIASGVEGTIISKGGSTTGNRQYQIFKASNDTIGVFIGGTVVSTSAYSDGNWHHVAVVNFDDSGTQKFKIYVDGSSDGLGTSGSGSNSFDVLLGSKKRIR